MTEHTHVVTDHTQGQTAVTQGQTAVTQGQTPVAHVQTQPNLDKPAVTPKPKPVNPLKRPSTLAAVVDMEPAAGGSFVETHDGTTLTVLAPYALPCI